MPIKHLALLDVDQTLLYNQMDMNHTLIEALMEKGITEVYLFTHMELADIRTYGYQNAPASRMDVIHSLASKGIRVIGVITPADPYWARHDSPQAVDAAFQTLYFPLMKKRIEQHTILDRKDYSSEDTLEYLFAQLEWDTASYTLREANRLIAGESKKIAKPGLCLVKNETGQPEEPKQFIHDLESAIKFFITGPNAEKHRRDYCLEPYPLAGFDIDISAATYATSDPKGAMMAHILLRSNLVQANTHIYFFDDREEHLEAVRESFVRHNTIENVKLLTCRVDSNYKRATDPSQKAVYQSCLNGEANHSSVTLISSKVKKESSVDMSAFFLLQVLAHPATKVVAGLFILVGAFGLVGGGLGLAGINLGLNLLMSSALTGFGAGSILTGTGLMASGFFASSKLESSKIVPISSLAEEGPSMK